MSPKGWIMWKCPTCGFEWDAPPGTIQVYCQQVDKHSDGTERLMKPQEEDDD